MATNLVQKVTTKCWFKSRQ